MTGKYILNDNNNVCGQSTFSEIIYSWLSSLSAHKVSADMTISEEMKLTPTKNIHGTRYAQKHLVSGSLSLEFGS